MNRILIIGYGPAAHRLADRMRQHGHTATLRILGAETEPAYNRVLLGSVLERTLRPESLHLPDLRPEVQVELGVTATSIDRSHGWVHTGTGTTERYDTLILATGAQPRIPDILGLRTDDGALAEGVLTVRTIADCERIGRPHRTVVLGGGILGVETACGLAARGAEVTLVHRHPFPMNRQLDAVGGRLLARRLHELGIHTRFERTAAEYRDRTLVLDDGDVLKSDALLLCTGIAPSTELAETANLAVRHGVVVDHQLRTSDPHIHAIGDCAEYMGEVAGLITPAWDQADTLAQLLTGSDVRYSGTPSVTRLRSRGIDLASIGAVREDHESDGELVTLSDPARGRYAKLALCDQCVTSAVLLGFPHAIASISQLHDRGMPAPVDRLSLLLGTATTDHSGSLVPPDEAIICRCNNVTAQALKQAWRSGARHLSEFAKATRATTGCGSCTDDVRRICTSMSSDSESTSTAQESTV